MSVPDDLRYSKDHEWVRLEGSVAVVGITDFAQGELGDVVFVELPQVGTALGPDAVVCEVESTKSVSDIYAPVGGTIAAVNQDLESTPELINSDPYGQGWIFTIEVSDVAQLDALMDGPAYSEMIGA